MNAFVFTGMMVLIATALGFAVWQTRRRNFQRWMVSYLADAPKRRLPAANEEVHVLLCVADHYEPKGYDASPAMAWSRVCHWSREYPARLGGFRDSDGRPPRHTFFYPIEEYEPEYLAALADLCAAGFGEVEIHLHHDHDTAALLRRRLVEFKQLLAEKHGLMSRDRMTGALVYGFVHGNWALDNSHPEGRWCGLNNELDILRETGCYADFTLPSAPDPTQTRKINRIYYAVDDPDRPKSHDWGTDIGRGPVPDKALLIMQGPLLLDWRKRKWGVFPHLENGCLQRSQPPSMARLPLWLRARVQVPGRPDWFFVKLHTHGAMEENYQALLGEPMVHFHQALREYAQRHSHFHYHYVTAREMYNLARAAEAGWTGGVAEARDFALVYNDFSPGRSAPPARSAEVIYASS